MVLHADPKPIFTAMLRRVLGDNLAESMTFLEMMSDHVEVEHPYAPNGGRRIIGRAALAVHLEKSALSFTVEHAHERHVFHAERLNTSIVEFDLSGRWVASGSMYEQQCVAFIEIENGRICRYREYWNPLAKGMPTPSQ